MLSRAAGKLLPFYSNYISTETFTAVRSCMTFIFSIHLMIHLSPALPHAAAEPISHASRGDTDAHKRHKEHPASHSLRGTLNTIIRVNIIYCNRIPYSALCPSSTRRQSAKSCLPTTCCATPFFHVRPVLLKHTLVPPKRLTVQLAL